jgi:hypothetical protein
MGVRGALTALLLAVFASPAPAQDSPLVPGALLPGALVRVTTAESIRHVGRLVAVNDTLLVIDPESILRPRERFDRRLLSRVEVKLPADRRAKATGIGALLGAAVGGAIGAGTFHDDCPGDSGGYGACIGRGQRTVAGAVAGAVVGGLIGRLVAQRDSWRVVSEAAR